MSEVTEIVARVAAGDRRAAAELLPLVYDELRKLAASRLAHESPGQTLDATALVHEAYVRLVGDQDAAQWDGRGHFFAAAAEAMRRILVEQARRKSRHKHGGGRERVELTDPVAPEDEKAEQLVAIDAALRRLAAEDPAAAQVVEMHYFAGLPLEEVGRLLGVSRATVYRQWKYARAWLRTEIERND